MSSADEADPGTKPSETAASGTEEEEPLNQEMREEEVETDQEFMVVPQEQEEELPDEEEDEEEEFEEEDEGEEYMEEDEEGEGDTSNAKNIYDVKEITDVLFSGGNFKEGDDLKNSLDFSETCVQQMFGKDILSDDPDEAGSSHSGESRLRSNGTGGGSGTEEGADTPSTPSSPPAAPTPSRRGRKRKKLTLSSRKRGGGAGGKRKKEEEEEEEAEGEEFPGEYLLSTGISQGDVEELKLGFTVLQDIMSQPCSSIFLNEPQMSEVSDKIAYDQLIDKPMWFTLVEQNLCKGIYRNLSDLMCDIRLIIENCYKFWKLRDDEMLREAFKLETCLNQRLVLLPEDVQSRVNSDLEHVSIEDSNGLDNGADGEKNFTVQDIRLKSPLFRLVESSPTGGQAPPPGGGALSKEALEADIIDFENNVVFADGNTIIETVNCMWELADIGHFLCLTHALLRVPQPTQLEVERMFLLPQSSSVLAALMTSLLVRPVSRVRLERGPPMPYSVWKTRLQIKVSEWYRVYHAKGQDDLEVFESVGIDPMFWNILGPDYSPLDSHDYHELHYFQRVWLFKGLCSYVLHNHKTMSDLFNTLPPASTRLPPLGSDRQGHAYYFYPDFIDVRLYRQNMPARPGAPPTSHHWVGNYLLLPLHLQQAELEAHRASLSANPKTPVNSVHVPLEERELFFPKQKFLPARRKDNLVILANSVEGLEILAGEMRGERQDARLLTALEEVLRGLKQREASIDYVTYRVRCAMFSEYTDYMKRPDNYEDPDLKYWTFKMKHLKEEDTGSQDSAFPSGLDSPRPAQENGEDTGCAESEGTLATRRSRREVHPVLKCLNPGLSDLDSEDSGGGSGRGGSSGGESGGFNDRDDSGDEWDPDSGKRGRKKAPLFTKPPVQGQDDKIRPASPDPPPRDGVNDLEDMAHLPPHLRTPGSSPSRPTEMGTMEDPLNVASVKKELVEDLGRAPMKGDALEVKQEPTPAPAPAPPRPVIKVKSNQSLVREDFSQAPNLLAVNPPAPLLMPPAAPLLPPLDVDPLATRLNVKREEVDDDIEVLEEKVLRPPSQAQPPLGENSIIKINNMVYQIRAPNMPLPPGTMLRLPMGMRPGGPRGVNAPRGVGGMDPAQQLIIQNPRTLMPGSRMRGRPSMNPGTGRAYYPRGMPPGPPGGSPRGAMRGSPRQLGATRGRGALNITPRKATPPPIPRQLLNRNISVSLVEPKPKPALPKLAGVTITPTKQKPSPAKTLIFNSPTAKAPLSSSPAKTQMVDANVQLQWTAGGGTSYVIELANNQTQALTKEQVQFFKNKHNGTMPNVVRIAVPVDIARRVKPPCITL